MLEHPLSLERREALPAYPSEPVELHGRVQIASAAEHLHLSGVRAPALSMVWLLAACGGTMLPGQRMAPDSSEVSGAQDAGPTSTFEWAPGRVVADADPFDLSVAGGVVYWVQIGESDAGAVLHLWRKALGTEAVELDVQPGSREAIIADASGVWFATSNQLWHYASTGSRELIANHGVAGGPGSMVQDDANLYLESYVDPSAFGGGRRVWRISKSAPHTSTYVNLPIDFSHQIAVVGGTFFWNFFAFEDNCDGMCPSHGSIRASPGTPSVTIMLDSAPAPGGFVITDGGMFVRVGDEVVRALPDAGSVPVAPCRIGAPPQLLELDGDLYCNAGGQGTSPDLGVGLWRISLDGGRATRIDGEGESYGAMATSGDAVFYIRDGDIMRAP